MVPLKSLNLPCQSVRRTLTVIIVMLAFTCLSVTAQTVRVVSWNVESGGSDDQTIRQRMASFQGVDLWGLSEVASVSSASIFETGAEDGEDANFSNIVSTTGGGDRLAIIFNADRFRLVRQQELLDINQGNHRAPLVVELQEISSNRNFLFMVNHLARGNANLRREQATKLNAWVRTQTLPTIAVGDYNFDWEVVGGDQDHDAGYDNMTNGGAWTWVRPATLIKSQCSPNFDSVLDFVFVNAVAQSWSGTSEIVVEPNDCVASPLTSDHRPLIGTFNMGGGGPGGPRLTKEQLLRKIEEIERQLIQLKDAVRLLP
jgi:hypothetical protein